MNWNALKNWIAPPTEIEFCNFEQTWDEKITINVIVCKKQGNGKFKCKTERGETFLIEEVPSCNDIEENYYKNRDEVLLLCRVNRVQRDFSTIYKTIAKGAIMAATSICPIMRPIKEIF